MFECWWQNEGFEAWHLRGDLRGASRRWQHRLQDELWLWFNDSGEGVVWGKDHRIFLKPGLFGCFGGQEGEDWKWTRLPGHHEGEILIVPRDYLARHFGEAAAAKKTPFARWLRGEKGVSFAGLMGTGEKRLAEKLASSQRRRLPGLHPAQPVREPSLRRQRHLLPLADRLQPRQRPMASRPAGVPHRGRAIHLVCRWSAAG